MAEVKEEKEEGGAPMPPQLKAKRKNSTIYNIYTRKYNYVIIEIYHYFIVYLFDTFIHYLVIVLNKDLYFYFF